MASQVKKFYEFGRFRFDTARLRLECDGEAVPLPRKSLETLKVLLDEKGETVTRENLLERIWAESFVEDANLTVAVSALRKALAVYDAEPLIETVPRRGYRFVGEAQEKVEDIDWPIIVEHHAVEQVTIEKKAAPRTRVLSMALLSGGLALIVTTAAFALLQWRGNAAAADLEPDPAAMEAFQKADGLLQKRQVCESIPHFREAISRDAAFARAHSGLAAALVMCEFTDEADSAIAKALELDPNLSEAHATDGFIKMFRHWDWDGAEAALGRAVALDPESAKAHHWLGVHLSIRGRFREAQGEMMRAIEIEPSSPLYHADLGQAYYFEGRPDAAILACRKALEIDPNFFFALEYLREIYLTMGDEKRSWEFNVKYLRSRGSATPESLAQGEQDFERQGYAGHFRDRNRQIFERIDSGKVDENDRPMYSLMLAENFARLRESENTLLWLETAVNGKKGRHPFATAYIAVDPRYAFLREEPRFQAILRTLDLR